MQSNFTIDHKTHEAKLTFKFEHLKELADYQNALTLLFIVCGDYQLDPELELSDFQELIEASKENDKTEISFFINEEEIEAQAN